MEHMRVALFPIRRLVCRVFGHRDIGYDMCARCGTWRSEWPGE